MIKNNFPIFVLVIAIILFLVCPSTASKADSVNPDSPNIGTLDSSANTFENPPVPKAAHQATVLYLVNRPSLPESLTLATLQGLLCNTGSEQILLKSGGWNFYIDYIKDNYNVTLSEQNEGTQPWTTWRLVEHFNDKISGYILCDNTRGSDSQNIAVSLARQLNAIVVTEAIEKDAISRGLRRLADTRSMTDSEFKSSSYFESINKDTAFQQPPGLLTVLADYAVMSGAYINFYDGKNPAEHQLMFDFLNPGAVLFGWNNVLGEYATINSLSKLNLSLVPADHAPNLSALSGFRLKSIKQKTKEVSPTPSGSNKHTVTFLLSDGDNLQWFLDHYARSNRHFNSDLRGAFAMGWGLPPTAIDQAAPMLNYYYDNMTPNDNFVAALSGLGYTFPSKWTDKSALDKMAAHMNDYMKRMDINILNMLDDLSTEEKFSNAAVTYAPFTKQDGIDAILYIDFGNYKQFKGKIIWSNSKPIISARHRLWHDLADSQMHVILEDIKQASRDPKNVDSYSFVLIHAWTGLNDEGKLVMRGNTMDAVKALIDQFDPDVDVVTPAEFVNRIVHHLKPD